MPHLTIDRYERTGTPVVHECDWCYECLDDHAEGHNRYCWISAQARNGIHSTLCTCQDVEDAEVLAEELDRQQEKAS